MEFGSRTLASSRMCSVTLCVRYTSTPPTGPACLAHGGPCGSRGSAHPLGPQLMRSLGQRPPRRHAAGRLQVPLMDRTCPALYSVQASPTNAWRACESPYTASRRPRRWLRKRPAQNGSRWQLCGLQRMRCPARPWARPSSSHPLWLAMSGHSLTLMRRVGFASSTHSPASGSERAEQSGFAASVSGSGWYVGSAVHGSISSHERSS